MKKLLIWAAIAATTMFAQGAGFGIYEASARGNAMGGAVVGDTHDATAAYYNPANLAFATNIMVSAGVTFINPYCDVEVDHRSQDRMNPGWFTVPTFYAAIPLPFDFAFGWGNYTEYGLGTKYGGHWDLAADTRKTTMEQVTLNPNLAYKITDWWSVSAGIRGSYIRFINHKKPYYGERFGTAYSHPQLGDFTLPTTANLNSKLKGDDWGMGWNAAMTFKPTDDLSIGLVYRSMIRHKIKGYFAMNGNAAALNPLTQETIRKAQYAHTHASAKLRLPESLTLGVNYNVTPRYRVGSAITYTRWSSLDKISFKIGGDRGYTQKFDWQDTVRVGFGMEYDFLEWLSGRIGYTFDEDPTSKHHQSTMLPAGDRHIIGTGLGFKITENLRLDLGYNFIRMNNEHYYVTYAADPNDKTRTNSKRMSCRNGFSHLASATLSYSF